MHFSRWQCMQRMRQCQLRSSMFSGCQSIQRSTRHCQGYVFALGRRSCCREASCLARRQKGSPWCVLLHMIAFKLRQLLIPLLFKHDIVRDFTLAAHTSDELQNMQRSFVDQLLQKTAVAKGDSNDHLSNYASTSLVHHIRCAVITPLHDDELAKTWLMDKNNEILDSVLLGIKQSEIQRLADWYNQDGDWFNAAHIFNIIGMFEHACL